MAIVTNTFLTFSAIGNREDLVDQIYNISPVEAPLQANIGKTKAEATFHEWQTDVLATAAANSVIQGDDTTSSYTFGSVTPTVRLGNRTNISRKDVVVSGTQDAVNKAGRKKEMVYQLLKKSKELARDMEVTLSQNQGIVTGTSTVAPALRSLETWAGVTSSTTTNNVSMGTGGANSVSGAARTDASGANQRYLTEQILKGVIQGAWQNGGEIDLVMPGPFNKTIISTFTGNSTRMQDTSSNKKLVAAIDVYVSDFGTHKVTPNRFTRDQSCFCLETDLFAVSYLRPKQTIDLAKLGDNEKAMILAEYTLESRNDSGSGWIFDLKTS